MKENKTLDEIVLSIGLIMIGFGVGYGVARIPKDSNNKIVYGTNHVEIRVVHEQKMGTFTSGFYPNLGSFTNNSAIKPTETNNEINAVPHWKELLK